MSARYIGKLPKRNYKTKSVIYKQSFEILRLNHCHQKNGHFLILSEWALIGYLFGIDLKPVGLIFFKFYFQKGIISMGNIG